MKESNVLKAILIIAIILVIIGIGFLGFGVYNKKTFKKENPIATVEIENYGTIKIELYPDQAPNTVANFIRLANNGYYDELTFHRTIPEFMIQGGDVNGDGTGTPTKQALDTTIAEEINIIKEKYAQCATNNDLTITEENANILSDKMKESKNNAEVTAGSENFIIKFNKTENEYSLSNDGKVILTSEDKTDKYSIPGEFLANGFKNTVKLEAGVIAMARSDYSSLSQSLAKKGYDSAGSQFFIVTKDQPNIDGAYAGFGKVIEGMDIVEKIANTEVYYRSSELDAGEDAPKDENGNEISSDMPKEKPVIKSIKVETYGVDYGMPKTLEPFDYYSWMMKNYYGSGASSIN